MIDKKKCTKCGEIKPLSEFHRHILKPDGHRSVCKLCRLKPSTKEQLELLSFGLRRCPKCNQIKPLNEFSKALTQCKLCLSEGTAQWRKLNRERVVQNRKSYREKNKDIITAKDREYHSKNRALAVQRVAQWRKKNPLKRKVQTETRRARKKNAEGTFSEADIISIHSQQGGLCIYCGKDLSKSMTIDHIIPLSRHGTNWTSNIQLLCVNCNASKKDKTHEEYLKYLKVVNVLRPLSSL